MSIEPPTVVVEPFLLVVNPYYEPLLVVKPPIKLDEKPPSSPATWFAHRLHPEAPPTSLHPNSTLPGRRRHHRTGPWGSHGGAMGTTTGTTTGTTGRSLKPTHQCEILMDVFTD